MAKLEVHPLMRTIVEYPDADLPRLVYADWLDEQDDPRLSLLAEYIRLSIEAESVSVGSPYWVRISQRLYELRQLAGATPCPPMPEYTSAAVLFQRGLPYLLCGTLSYFADGAAEALEYAPITALSLAPIQGRFPSNDGRLAVAAFRRPELHRVRSLSVVADLDDSAIEELVSAMNPKNLRSLTLGLQALTSNGANSLATFADFPHLRHISFSLGRIRSRERSILQRAFGDRLKLNGEPA